MKPESTQIIIRPLVTEKGTLGIERMNAYPFEVDMRATKSEIKRAIEELFNVRVKHVRTQIRRGKPRRVRFRRGKTRDWKKAIVTLMPGESIEFI